MSASTPDLPTRLATEAAADIFERIKHGDEAHRAWLFQECNSAVRDRIAAAVRAALEGAREEQA